VTRPFKPRASKRFGDSACAQRDGVPVRTPYVPSTNVISTCSNHARAYLPASARNGYGSRATRPRTPRQSARKGPCAPASSAYVGFPASTNRNRRRGHWAFQRRTGVATDRRQCVDLPLRGIIEACNVGALALTVSIDTPTRVATSRCTSSARTNVGISYRVGRGNMPFSMRLLETVAVDSIMLRLRCERPPIFRRPSRRRPCACKRKPRAQRTVVDCAECKVGSELTPLEVFHHV
jgi:hypothetical protein